VRVCVRVHVPLCVFVCFCACVCETRVYCDSSPSITCSSSSSSSCSSPLCACVHVMRNTHKQCQVVGFEEMGQPIQCAHTRHCQRAIPYTSYSRWPDLWPMSAFRSQHRVSDRHYMPQVPLFIKKKSRRADMSMYTRRDTKAVPSSHAHAPAPPPTPQHNPLVHTLSQKARHKQTHTHLFLGEWVLTKSQTQTHTPLPQ
jgi:hypothetical protein